jgi:hypothetical protein
MKMDELFMSIGNVFFLQKLNKRKKMEIFILIF